MATVCWLLLCELRNKKLIFLCCEVFIVPTAYYLSCWNESLCEQRNEKVKYFLCRQFTASCCLTKAYVSSVVRKYNISCEFTA